MLGDAHDRDGGDGLELDLCLAGKRHEFARHGRAVADGVADRVDRIDDQRILLFQPRDLDRVGDGGEHVVHVVRNRTREQRERLLLARVRQARFGGKAASVLLRVFRHVAHNGKREQIVHADQAHVEVSRMASPSRVEQETLHAAGGEHDVDGLPDRVDARTSEHGHVNGLPLRQARHGIDEVRLLDDRDESVLAVEDEESVRKAVDQRLLTVLHLGDGHRAV